jgi:hypothetical protein
MWWVPGRSAVGEPGAAFGEEGLDAFAVVGAAGSVERQPRRFAIGEVAPSMIFSMMDRAARTETWDCRSILSARSSTVVARSLVSTIRSTSLARR